MKTQRIGAMWGVSLVLILGLAYFMNATNFLSKPLFPEKPKVDPAATALSKDQLKVGLKEGMRAKRDPSEMRSEEGSGLPSEPAILKPKVKAYKPTPNETSTSSQWYSKDGYVDQKREEVQKKRGF